MILSGELCTPEHKLIVPLFNNPFFINPETLINLASYPTVSKNQKPALIGKILKNLWPEQLREDIYKLFERLESLLIAIGQRDHFLHQFYVFLIGIHVIDIIQSKASQDEKNKIFPLLSREEVFVAWLMASTTHDFGKPAAEAKRLNKEISDLFKAFGMENLSNFYKLGAINQDLKADKIFHKLALYQGKPDSCIQNVLDFDFLLSEQIAKALNIEKCKADALVQERKNLVTHGYLGAIILCRNVIKNIVFQPGYKDYNTLQSSSLFKSLLPAMAAIFIHDLGESDHWRNLHPRNNFFAFLLCLTDVLQEWDRNIRPNEEYADCLLEGFNRDNNNSRIEIEYGLYHQNWKPSVLDEVKKQFAVKRNLLEKLKPELPLLGLKLSLKYSSIQQGASATLDFSC